MIGLMAACSPKPIVVNDGPEIICARPIPSKLEVLEKKELNTLVPDKASLERYGREGAYEILFREKVIESLQVNLNQVIDHAIKQNDTINCYEQLTKKK
jgi:hypothetical protein